MGSIDPVMSPEGAFVDAIPLLSPSGTMGCGTVPVKRLGRFGKTGTVRQQLTYHWVTLMDRIHGELNSFSGLNRYSEIHQPIGTLTST